MVIAEKECGIPLRRNEIMWKNYLVASFRSLRRNKRFAFINILGLAVGLAVCLLITSYVIHELSFDRMHVRAESELL